MSSSFEQSSIRHHLISLLHNGVHFTPRKISTKFVLRHLFSHRSDALPVQSGRNFNPFLKRAVYANPGPTYGCTSASYLPMRWWWEIFSSWTRYPVDNNRQQRFANPVLYSIKMYTPREKLCATFCCGARTRTKQFYPALYNLLSCCSRKMLAGFWNICA